MLIVTNAFSLNMLESGSYRIRARTIGPEEAGAMVRAGGHDGMDAFGHEDIARLAALLMGLPDRADAWAERAKARPTVTARPGDIILVAQYRGPRLPAGATRLPEGATIEFWVVVIEAE